MSAPNIVSWELIYDSQWWNRDLENTLVIAIPYINKYENTRSWHEHNLCQTSWLDGEGCLSIKIQSEEEWRKKHPERMASINSSKRA